jgi:transglutaminase-like putative cysteine protease
MTIDPLGNALYFATLGEYFKIVTQKLYAWITAPVYPHFVFMGPPWPVPRYANICSLFLLLGIFLALCFAMSESSAQSKGN